jgi:hypothetical protein
LCQQSAFAFALKVRASGENSPCCCICATHAPTRHRYADLGWGADAMFDVYLSDRRCLLVVRKGFPIPLGDASSRWRKSKKRVVSVSREIRLAVQRQGCYVRRLKDLKTS